MLFCYSSLVVSLDLLNPKHKNKNRYSRKVRFAMNKFDTLCTRDATTRDRYRIFPRGGGGGGWIVACMDILYLDIL